jgi:hypothetical protein
MDIRPRDIPDLRYPIGKFTFPDQVTAQERAKFVEQIAEAPARMKAAVAGLSDEQSGPAVGVSARLFIMSPIAI